MRFHGRGAYIHIVDPDPPRGHVAVREADAVQCSHCDALVTILPGVDIHRCTVCDSIVCKHCAGKGCHPMEKKLEKWESRRHLDRILVD
jgi:hypothetical protein